jgi:hypothetical protein
MDVPIVTKRDVNAFIASELLSAIGIIDEPATDLVI